MQIFKTYVYDKNFVSIHSLGLTGILFPDRSENAYSALRIWQAIGFTVGFASAEFLTIEGRLWILLGTVILAAIFNLLVECNTQTKEQLMPCGNRSSKKGNYPVTPGDFKPDDHIVDLPQSPSYSNILFSTYDGRRPNNWSMGFNSSRRPSVNRQDHNDANIVLNDVILEEGGENEQEHEHESVVPQKRNSIDPSPSYCQAVSYSLELEEVNLSEVVVTVPSLPLPPPQRRGSINPAVSYSNALQHAGILY